jgi:Ala-tRNA(Pro) deacylase
MAIPLNVREFLNQSGREWDEVHHRPAYSAQREAAITHVPGRLWAKTVVCIADGEAIIAVLPAHYRLDLERLRIAAKATNVRLAREAEIGALYPDCETGAAPPLGPLYNERVFVDESLTTDPEITFHAGTHTDAVRMRYADFAMLVKPLVARFANSPVRAH